MNPALVFRPSRGPSQSAPSSCSTSSRAPLFLMSGAAQDSQARLLLKMATSGTASISAGICSTLLPRKESKEVSGSSTLVKAGK